MIPADHPVAPLDRTLNHGRPHLGRTAVLLALIGAALLTVAWAAAELTGPTYELPREVYQPSYPVTAPVWLEPTRVPATPARAARPPHPASIYTPPAR